MSGTICHRPRHQPLSFDRSLRSPASRRCLFHVSILPAGLVSEQARRYYINLRRKSRKIAEKKPEIALKLYRNNTRRFCRTSLALQKSFSRDFCFVCFCFFLFSPVFLCCHCYCYGMYSTTGLRRSLPLCNVLLFNIFLLFGCFCKKMRTSLNRLIY